ncbi:hypothetical protein LTS15_001683 [Exophiala xenobiotica]|nr:hypothetical protein LTS15_001683 [Exophiala xenobiotica]
MVTLMPTQNLSRNKAVVKATGKDFLDMSSTLKILTRSRGREGDEAQDYPYNLANARRRSNSSTQALGDFKTKFEAIETDPVFEEELHGPTDDDIEQASNLSKEESTDSSTLGGSLDDDHKM